MAKELNPSIATAAAGMLAHRFPELTGANIEAVIERGLKDETKRDSVLDMPFLTRMQTANLLRVSLMTVQRMLADGRLPGATKIGKHSVRIPAASVEQLLTGPNSTVTEENTAESAKND